MKKCESIFSYNVPDDFFYCDPEPEDLSERECSIPIGFSSYQSHGVNPAHTMFPMRRDYEKTPHHRSGWKAPTPALFKCKSKELQNRINEFAEYKLPLLILDELEDLMEPERSNLHSFYVNLYSYRCSVEKEFRPMEIDTIFSRSMNEGPSFAKWLDGAKAAWLGYYANRKYYSDEIYDNYPSLKIFTKEKYIDLSGIYRSNSLFFWEPERPDLKSICFKPVITDENVVNDFRQMLRLYLTDPRISMLSEPDWRIFTRSSDKGTLDGKNFTIEESVFPAKVRGKTRISYVPRELKGSRAAPVNDYASALRIRWIDASVNLILSFDNRALGKEDPAVLKRKLQKAVSKRSWSYCRDFNKEGLTKPRFILRILIEELHAATGWSVFDCHSFFDEWVYIDDGEEFSPPRGHGLGSANALTTLMSIIIEQLVTKELGIAVKCSGYNNDDAFVIIDNKDRIMKYGHIDRKICKSLGLEFKPKASYLARGEVSFCEQYAIFHNKTYGWKGSYYKEAFFNLLKCRNSAHAQELARGTDVRFVSVEDQNMVLEYWGPIMFRNEQDRPKELGGWFSSNFSGIVTCFYDKSYDQIIPREECSAINSLRENVVSFKKWDKRKFKNRFREEFNPLFMDKLEEPEYIYAKDVARPSLDRDDEKLSWDKFLIRLRKSYKKFTKSYDLGEKMTYGEYYDILSKENPATDIIPPRGKRIVLDIFEGSTINKEFFSPYVTTGITHSEYLFNHHDTVYPDKANLNKISLGVLKSETSNYRDAIKRTELKFPHLGRDWETYLYPNEQVIKVCNKPFEYVRACDRIIQNEYEVVIPNEIPEEKKQLLEERRKVYRCELSAEDWLQIGSLKPVDIVIPQIVWKDLLDQQERDSVLKALRKYPNFGAIALSCDSEEWPNRLREYIAASKESKRACTTYEIKELPTDNIVVPRDFLESSEEEDSFSSDSDIVEYQDQTEEVFDVEVLEKLHFEVPENQDHQEDVYDYISDDSLSWHTIISEEEAAEQGLAEDLCQFYI